MNKKNQFVQQQSSLGFNTNEFFHGTSLDATRPASHQITSRIQNTANLGDSVDAVANNSKMVNHEGGAIASERPSGWGIPNPIKAAKKAFNTVTETVKETVSDTRDWLQEQGNSISDVVHTGLDVAGLLPGFGAVPDLLNAGIYLLEGKPSEAALSALAAVPVAGDAAKATQLAVKGTRLMRNADKANDIIKMANKVDDLAKLTGKAQNFVSLPNNIEGMIGSAENAVEQFSQGQFLGGAVSLVNADVSRRATRDGFRAFASPVKSDKDLSREAEERKVARHKAIGTSKSYSSTPSDLSTWGYRPSDGERSMGRDEWEKLDRETRIKQKRSDKGFTYLSDSSSSPSYGNIDHASMSTGQTPPPIFDASGMIPYVGSILPSNTESQPTGQTPPPILDASGMIPYVGSILSSNTESQPSGSAGQEYTIQSGDSLWSVAQKQLGDGARWRELRKSDGSSFTDSDTRNLKPGTSVMLPGTESPQSLPQPAESGSPTPTDLPSSASPTSDRQTYTIQAGDTLSAIAQRELGDANRWREITRENGQGFTDNEARQLQIGQTVSIPGQTPITSPPVNLPNTSSPQSPGSYNIDNVPDIWKDKANPYLSTLINAFAQQGITNPTVLAYAAATIGLESSWNPNAKNKTDRYKNTPWSGKGLAQVTTENNYKKLSEMTGIDFVNHPEYMFDPEKSLTAKAAFYKMNNMVPLIEQGDYESAAGIYNEGNPRIRSSYTQKVASAVNEWLDVFADIPSNPNAFANVPITSLQTPDIQAVTGQPITVQSSSDTLWSIAQKNLGSGIRWGELLKGDGTPFTKDEAQKLQIGTQVFLPGSLSQSQPQPTPTPAPTTASASASVQNMLQTAESFMGLKEEGNNRGATVDMFNRSAGLSEGQPWCMSFMQYCIQQSQAKTGSQSSIYTSGNCDTVWKNSPENMQIASPEPGALFIRSSHVGMIESVDWTNHTFTTIEGNASNSVKRNTYNFSAETHNTDHSDYLGYLRVFA